MLFAPVSPAFPRRPLASEKSWIGTHAYERELRAMGEKR